jgi:hypothetical protein
LVQRLAAIGAKSSKAAGVEKMNFDRKKTGRRRPKEEDPCRTEWTSHGVDKGLVTRCEIRTARHGNWHPAKSCDA